MDPLLKVKRELEASLEALKDSMAAGAAGDYATYRELVGRVTSVELTLAYIEDVEKQYIEE